MKQIKYYLIAIIFTSSIGVNAQLSHFDLSQYKLPDLDRRSLETNIMISGFTNLQHNSNFYSLSTLSDKYQNNRFNSSLSLDYNHYQNSRKFQKETNFSVNFSSTNNKIVNENNTSEIKSKSSNLLPEIYFQKSIRKYNENNGFTGIDLNFSFEYYHEKTESTNGLSESKRNRDNYQFMINIPLKTGTGRIEPVNDARHAVYLFDELSKVNRVSGEKSDEEIIQFAKLISELKNKRFFDSRIRRIAELESVDSFLIANNYLTESDATYFTTLADFWGYGNTPVRRSGKRTAFVFSPAYFFNKQDVSEDYSYYYSDGTFQSFLLNAGIETMKETPVNLKWQKSFELNAYGGIIEGKIKDEYLTEKVTVRIPNIQAGIYQTYSYYPNTRTGISLSLSAQYAQLFDVSDEDNEIIGLEDKGAKIACDLNINYYFSPKLRLNAYSSFHYIWQNLENGSIFNFNNVAAGEPLVSNLINEGPVTNYRYFEKEFNHTFSVSLLYSFF